MTPPTGSCPIADVVSAWDSIANMTPAEWLAARVPLLRQFLEADQNGYSYRGFGSPPRVEFAQNEGVTDPNEPDPWDRAWRSMGPARGCRWPHG